MESANPIEESSVVVFISDLVDKFKLNGFNIHENDSVIKINFPNGTVDIRRDGDTIEIAYAIQDQKRHSVSFDFNEKTVPDAYDEIISVMNEK